jgi:hypothetical protein
MAEVRIRVAPEIEARTNRLHAKAKKDRQLPHLSKNTYLSEIWIATVERLESEQGAKK